MRSITDHISTYQAIKVRLESDDSPPEVVTRPTIPDLDYPYLGDIKDNKGEVIAFYWAALRRQLKPEEPRGQIPPEYKDSRGFIYKIKGFTIGDNERLRRIFKTGNSGLYWWFTGEIYVVDKKVVPNAERNDFETGAAQRVLESQVEEALKSLEGRAAKYQSQERAVSKFLVAQGDIRKLRQATGADPVVTHSDLSKLHEELLNQKKKLEESKRPWGQEIIDECERLRKQLHREIMRPQENRDGRKRTTHVPVPDADPLPTTSTPPETLLTPAALRALSDVFSNAGREVDEPVRQILEIVDQAISDVLGVGSMLHLEILQLVDAKLTEDED